MHSVFRRMAVFFTVLHHFFWATLPLVAHGIKTDAPPLVIGTNAEFPPFCFREGGEIVGFDVEVAQEVALLLNRQAVLRDMPFETLIPDLSLGQIDLIAAGMTSTPERAKRVAFTRPYLVGDPLVMLVLKKNQAWLKTDLEALRDKKIVVNEGYTADLYLSKDAQQELIRLASPADAFLALKTGRADAFVTAHSTLHQFLRTQTEEQFVYAPLASTPEESCSLVVSKNNSSLLREVQEALDILEENGTMDRLKKKWQLP